MPDQNDLEPRILKLERDVASQREDVGQARADAAAARDDAAAARRMAAGADRDVAESRQELRAHTTVLNALRQTQLDNHKEFVDFRAETRANFARVDANLEKVESVLASVAVGQLHITHLLENITDK